MALPYGSALDLRHEESGPASRRHSPAWVSSTSGPVSLRSRKLRMDGVVAFAVISPGPVSIADVVHQVGARGSEGVLVLPLRGGDQRQGPQVGLHASWWSSSSKTSPTSSRRGRSPSIDTRASLLEKSAVTIHSR